MQGKKNFFKPELQEIPQLRTKMTFLYLEHCKLNRDSNSITISNKDGIVYLPAMSICTLLLGPGTSVTHQAVELISEAGITIVWVGEEGVRYYASGRPLSRSSSMLLKQAELVCNRNSHIQVARIMYQMRFPNEDVSMLTMQQLRGREGSRIRQAYRVASKKWGIEWNGRDYKPDDYSSGDDVNKALSAGNACLYGLVHAVVAALGCSPGLGFVHIGHDNSFVYDVADLYKAEITIPLAFEVASENPVEIGSEMRRRVRDAMISRHLVERIVDDIHTLFSMDTCDETFHDEVLLWNGVDDLVKNGCNFAPLNSENNDGIDC